MKTSEAFKQAKQCLQPIGEARYICHALAEALYGRAACTARFDKWRSIYSTKTPGFSTAIKVITDRIGGEAALETWLDRQGIEYGTYAPSQMEKYRHRWIDALIAEFEAKGD